MSDWSLHFELTRIGYASLLLGALALILTWRRYAAPRSAIPRPVRGMLIVLRTLALAAILFMLVRPVMAGRSVRYERPILTVLLDHSKSLRIRDVAPANGSRAIARVEAMAAA